jgi:hypothetical protein
VEKVQEYARARHVRVTFLSGDVHCAAVGYFKTLVRPKAKEVDPMMDHRYMLNVSLLFLSLDDGCLNYCARL